MNQEEAWSARYGSVGDDYLFGTAPNAFLARHVALFQPGQSALSVADGEGRNSVWLAEQGLAVAAVEISAPAVDKARRLAAERQVAPRFILADMLAPDWPPREFDAAFDWVVGIFIQFVDAALRARQFAVLRQSTRPGGRILLLGYAHKQLDYRTGGPAAIENLYSDALLYAAFADWEIEELVAYEDDLGEGSAHCGRSALVGLVARRPPRGG